MRKTRISLIIIVAITLNLISLGFFISNTAADTSINLPNYEPMEFGPELKAMDMDLNLEFPASQEIALRSSAAAVTPLEGKWWFEADFYTGYYQWEYYYLMNESLNCQVWVSADLGWLEGDPRDEPIVLQEQVNYILDEFDKNIYFQDTTYFGEPDFHNGFDSLLAAWGDVPPGYYDDSEGKNVILISNIKDDSYYDPTYPAYIVGFYSPSFEAYFDRNIISIDCYAYEKRLGDEGKEWVPGVEVDRPNVYESTVAHEYQHLIHDDYILAPESWMNEACSLFAEPLCGYELDTGQIEWFLATPDNSLTKWGDQGGINILADYGASFLWALYLTSHYGFNFMGQYVQAGLNGVEGVEALLPEGISFLDVFHDWRLANLINAECGPYSYSVFGFNLDDLEPISILEAKAHWKWKSASDYFGETYTIGTDDVPEGYPTGVFDLTPFGTDYFTLKNLKKLNLFMFDGDDIAIYGWTFDDYWNEWWSGAENLYDALLITNPHVYQAGDVLSVPSWYSIEAYWDFGFVQYSLDGGETWTSMSNEYTTYSHYSDAHPNIVAQLPGITNSSEGGYIDLQFALDEIEGLIPGMEIVFGFRYMTDWNTLGAGWYIVQAGVYNSDDYAPLELTPIYPEADFMVTIVKKYHRSGKDYYYIHDMKLKLDGKELGIDFIYTSKAEDIIFLVSPVHMDGAVDYEFATFKLWGRRHFHC